MSDKLERALRALREIASEDYRGPRPHSAVIAEQALREIEAEPPTSPPP